MGQVDLCGAPLTPHDRHGVGGLDQLVAPDLAVAVAGQQLVEVRTQLGANEGEAKERRQLPDEVGEPGEELAVARAVLVLLFRGDFGGGLTELLQAEVGGPLELGPRLVPENDELVTIVAYALLA